MECRKKKTCLRKNLSSVMQREKALLTTQINNGRGPLEKFVEPPYYFESELCGAAVTVSFSKYLLKQAMHFLQHSTHFSKTCCRPLITSKFLASELPFHGARSGLYGECSNGVPAIHFYQAEQNSIQISIHKISVVFQP
jgi:hypothetical protein